MSRQTTLVLIPVFVLFFIFFIWNFKTEDSSSNSTTRNIREPQITMPTLIDMMTVNNNNNNKNSISYGGKISTVEFEENTNNQENPSAATCKLKPNTFKDLGQFPFWGKIMNASFPCPAAGMNNQLTLLLAFWHCYETKLKLSSSSPSSSGFKWKDISCSPTGGKDGNRRFVVGSSDYSYAWFRWSEVFKIRTVPRYFLGTSGRSNSDDDADEDSTDNNNKKKRLTLMMMNNNKKKWKSTLCLHDSYTWKEHPELARCNSNIGHLYGSQTWWELRGRLEPRVRFQLFAKCFLQAAKEVGGENMMNDNNNDNNNNNNNNNNNVEDEKSKSDGYLSPVMNPLKKRFLKCISTISSHHSASSSPTTTTVDVDENLININTNKNQSNNGVLGLHIRRGDYAHFCAGLKGSSGIRKFRVPPFKWLSKTTEQLSTKFPDTCAPSDARILDHIKNLIRKSQKSENPIKTVFIASNSESLVEKIRSSLSSKNGNNNNNNQRPTVTVFALADIIGKVDTKTDSEKIHQIWPDELYHDKWRSEKYWRAQKYSSTDKVMMDIAILSLCQVVVLNRYSTFSQSVIDERVLLSATEHYNNKEENVIDFSSLPGLAEGVKWW